VAAGVQACRHIILSASEDQPGGRSWA